MALVRDSGTGLSRSAPSQRGLWRACGFGAAQMLGGSTLSEHQICSTAVVDAANASADNAGMRLGHFDLNPFVTLHVLGIDHDLDAAHQWLRQQLKDVASVA